MADTPDLGSGGRPWGFESLHPHCLESLDEKSSRLFLLAGMFVEANICARVDSVLKIGYKYSTS